MNAWLATIVGESAAPIVGFILLFILVIALLLLVFAILRRVTGGTFVAGGRNRQVRLSVTDAAAVDNRRRLVLVRRDDVEHLILIGGPSDLVIEQNIRQFARQTRIEPPATGPTPEPEPRIPDPKPEPKVAEASPRAQPRVAPPTPPADTPPPVAQTTPTPQIPLRPGPPQQSEPPRRPPEPPRQAEQPVPLPPVPPMQPIPPVAKAPEAESAASNEPPAVSAPARDNGWQRTASPSFGTMPRAEPNIDTPGPAREVAASETRTTTAAAFPFAVRNEPAAAFRKATLDASVETEESEITLGDMDFSDAFETDLGSELNIAPGKEAKPEKQDSIEDEMERLLGDLSRPEKR
ncbi:flagellar biosynthetic protein FliO [Phyllobacterium zundukense]|uniref:Flagellar biosynthetic protein FliO n=1 Tax=Phyllobacterium zundukense TaxID=1867719 RepID=A0ACD4D211_9HYPH|nr:flagellar biosynthetic protein FliO [Phyllobacterium zundukense]UXN59851.1 flagellar biosynthetic protein FliO [Phyllobacterium zundukense]